MEENQEITELNIATSKEELEKIQREIDVEKTKFNSIKTDFESKQIEFESLSRITAEKNEELQNITNLYTQVKLDSDTITAELNEKKLELTSLEKKLKTYRERDKKENEKIDNLNKKINNLEINLGLYQNNLEGISKQTTNFKKTYARFSAGILFLLSLFSLGSLAILILPEFFSSKLFISESYGEYITGLKNHSYISILIFKIPLLTLVGFISYGLFKLFRGFISINITASKQLNGLFSISFLLKEIRDSKNIVGLSSAEIVLIENEILKEQYAKLSQYIEGILKQNDDQFIELSNVKHPFDHAKEIFEIFAKNSAEIFKTIKNSTGNN